MECCGVNKQHKRRHGGKASHLLFKPFFPPTSFFFILNYQQQVVVACCGNVLTFSNYYDFKILLRQGINNQSSHLHTHSLSFHSQRAHIQAMILRHSNLCCKRMQQYSSKYFAICNLGVAGRFVSTTPEHFHFTTADLQEQLRFYTPSKQLIKRMKKLSKGQSCQQQITSSSHFKQQHQRLLFLEGHRLVLDALSIHKRVSGPHFPLVAEVFLSAKAVTAPLGNALLSALLVIQQQHEQHAAQSDDADTDVDGTPTLRLYWVNAEVMSHLTATNTSQGVCAVVPHTPHAPASAHDLRKLLWPPCASAAESVQVASSLAPSLVVCDGVADPGNMGTIIRTSYGMGMGGVVTVQGCDPWVSRVESCTRPAHAVYPDLTPT